MIQIWVPIVVLRIVENQMEHVVDTGLIQSGEGRIAKIVVRDSSYDQCIGYVK